MTSNIDPSRPFRGVFPVVPTTFTEAITLLPDLDAGATGSMTGGGYPDGIRRIIDAYAAGRCEDATAEYTRWLPLVLRWGR